MSITARIAKNNSILPASPRRHQNKGGREELLYMPPLPGRGQDGCELGRSYDFSVGSSMIENHQGGVESAGINRHGIGNARAPHERRSCSIMAPSHVRVGARLHVKPLTGESTGQPLSSEITHQGCDPVTLRGRQHWGVRYAASPPRVPRSLRPCARAVDQEAHQICPRRIP